MNTKVKSSKNGKEHSGFEPEPIACIPGKKSFTLYLNNQSKIEFPIDVTERLKRASVRQRSIIELSAFGVHWPEIDEDLSVRWLSKTQKLSLPVRKRKLAA
ncbi:MAG: DUF2442 domain-containing protein [Verrucomicrobiae bacterium]|nr:DUF2442 domain-containing protein [Verrucomicrobiae bacterium]